MIASMAGKNEKYQSNWRGARKYQVDKETRLKKLHRVRWRALRWSDRHHRVELETQPHRRRWRFTITMLLFAVIAASAAGYAASRLLDAGKR